MKTAFVMIIVILTSLTGCRKGDAGPARDLLNDTEQLILGKWTAVKLDELRIDSCWDCYSSVIQTYDTVITIVDTVITEFKGLASVTFTDLLTVLNGTTLPDVKDCVDSLFNVLHSDKYESATTWNAGNGLLSVRIWTTGYTHSWEIKTQTADSLVLYSYEVRNYQDYYEFGNRHGIQYRTRTLWLRK